MISQCSLINLHTRYFIKCSFDKNNLPVSLLIKKGAEILKTQQYMELP